MISQSTTTTQAGEEVTATRIDVLDRAATEIELFREQLPALPDEILLTRGRLKEAIRRGRELLGEIETEVMLPFIRAHGEIVAGDIRYFEGVDKTEKCRDIRKAIEAIHIASSGDYDVFCDCLSANALKFGACKKVLGAEYANHFETVVKPSLEEGKAKTKLVELNTKFVK